MSVSIIIPNYNGKHLLKKNLPNVIREAGRLGSAVREIIIVDDASSDGSIHWIESYSHSRKTLPCRIIILENLANLGFSATVNKGVMRATGDVVVLLNTDVYPERNFLKAALPHFENPDVFGVGFLDKSKEDGRTITRGRGIGWWEKGMYVHKRGEINGTDTSWISGGSCAIKRSIFLAIGGFNELYSPFYWEDIDLSYRASKIGYKLYFEPKSAVIHEHAAGAIKSHYQPWQIKRIAYRNQFIFIWTNATIRQFITHLLWLPYHALLALKRGDLLFIYGYGDALARLLQAAIRQPRTIGMKSVVIDD